MHGRALPVPVGRCSVVWMNDVGCAGATRGPPEAERRGRRERTDVRQAYLVVLVETTAKDCDWPGGRLTHSHLIHSTFQQAPHPPSAHTFSSSRRLCGLRDFLSFLTFIVFCGPFSSPGQNSSRFHPMVSDGVSGAGVQISPSRSTQRRRSPTPPIDLARTITHPAPTWQSVDAKCEVVVEGEPAMSTLERHTAVAGDRVQRPPLFNEGDRWPTIAGTILYVVLSPMIAIYVVVDASPEALRLLGFPATYVGAAPLNARPWDLYRGRAYR